MRYVYILGSDSTYYVGFTNDIQRRLKEHKLQKTQSTSRLKNIYLIGYFIKQTQEDAFVLEKKIKNNGHIDHRINHSTFTKHTT